MGQRQEEEELGFKLGKETAGLPTPLYFKVVDIINDYQVESHYIFFYAAFLHPF